jgi:hypothetical protein
VVQDVLQAVPAALHPKLLAQMVVGSTAQAPPLQEAGVDFSLAHVFEHEPSWPIGAVQTLVCIPSHTGAQTMSAPAHAPRAPCGVPVTAMHVPVCPDTSHASHWPAQALLQQTPSTQLPDGHSRHAPPLQSPAGLHVAP